MSTDSHGHDPQGGTGGASFREDDTNAPSRPVHAGARRRTGDESRRPTKAPSRRRRKARRVHRVVHHFDIWSLAKVASIFVLCGYVISMISGFLLWRAADRVGTIDGIEGFMEDTGGYDAFVIRGDVVFSSALLIGAVLSILAVCLIVLAGILFNLISDLTGGIRMTVIDEDLIVTPARRGARPRTAPTPDDADRQADPGAAPTATPAPSQPGPDERVPVESAPDEPTTGDGSEPWTDEPTADDPTIAAATPTGPNRPQRPTTPPPGPAPTIDFG